MDKWIDLMPEEVKALAKSNLSFAKVAERIATGDPQLIDSLAEVAERIAETFATGDLEAINLLEREFELLRSWADTGELDRQQDWNLKKSISQLKRRRGISKRRRFSLAPAELPPGPFAESTDDDRQQV